MRPQALARFSSAVLTALPLVPAAAQEPATGTSVFLVIPGEETPRIVAHPLADGQQLTLELGPGGDALGVVLPPFAPGISGEVLQAGSSLAVAASLENGRLSLREAGPSGRDLASATLEELAGYRLRISLVGAGGWASSWILEGWEVPRRDAVGPPLDMFRGMFPLSQDDWLMSTEVRRVEAGPAALGEVPLIRSGNHLFTPFDGQRWFLIDTAAASTIVVPETLPEGVEIEPATLTERSAAGTRVLDATPPQGATGEVGGLLGNARCPELAIGPLRFRGAQVRVLEALPVIDGMPLAGILGIDLLSRCATLELSFAREGENAGRLRLLDGAKPSGEPDLRLPFARVHQLLFVRGTLADTPVHLAVDLGSSYDFLIDRCAALAPALDPPESVEYRGLGDEADTLSNLRNDLRGRLAGSEDLYTSIGELGSLDLSPDPYATMAMVAHEAFHVFQDLEAPEKLASELWLLEYPVLSAANNLGVALEAREVAAALTAQDPDALRAAALGWLAIREERRAALSERAIAYEDGTEFSEGLATYVEWRFAEAFEGREPRPALWYARGFLGFEDLAFLREQMLERMVASCSGEIALNNDPYGTAPVRMRLYWSGMAAGALLDRLGADWHESILEPGTTLTGLVRAALDPRPEELRAALERVDADPEHDRLANTAKVREWKGRLAAQAQVEAILEGPGTLLTIDHSLLGEADVAFGFTPFGLTLVSPTRRIYKMVPISARFPDGSTLRQSRPAPLLADGDDRTARFRLAGEVLPEDLLSQLDARELGKAIFEDLTLELPGATLHATRARVQLEGGELRLQLVPK